MVQYVYYILVEEWLYPTESGHDTCEHTFETPDDVLAYAAKKAEEEVANFRNATQCDCLPPAVYESAEGDAGGYIITTKMGLEPWYYACRIFRVAPLAKEARK